MFEQQREHNTIRKQELHQYALMILSPSAETDARGDEGLLDGDEIPGYKRG